MENSKFIEGIAIIGKYQKADGYDIAVGHDQFFFGDYQSVTDKKDVSRLKKLGWEVIEVVAKGKPKELRKTVTKSKKRKKSD